MEKIIKSLSKIFQNPVLPDSCYESHFIKSDLKPEIVISKAYSLMGDYLANIVYFNEEGLASVVSKPRLIGKPATPTQVNKNVTYHPPRDDILGFIRVKSFYDVDKRKPVENADILNLSLNKILNE